MKYISHDQGTYGRERPDFVFDAVTHMIVVEIDEDQHKYYPCECEQIRMINISQSLGMPTIFIRYNPDKYQSSYRLYSEKERMKALKHQIEHWSNVALPKDGFCYVTHLFYDDDPSQWKNPTKLC